MAINKITLLKMQEMPKRDDPRFKHRVEGKGDSTKGAGGHTLRDTLLSKHGILIIPANVHSLPQTRMFHQQNGRCYSTQ